MIEFINKPHKNPRAKKKTWIEHSRHGIIIGEIRWWEPDQEYMFYMVPSRVTNAVSRGELKAIADFLDGENGPKL